MSEQKKIGTIGWIDLTVENAEQVREFYASVVGWKHSPVSMGDYSDFNMTPPDEDTPVAGVCHTRGSNAAMPSKWLIYIVVEDLKSSLERCETLGGKVLVAPRSGFSVIQDPAGAVCALYQPE